MKIQYLSDLFGLKIKHFYLEKQVILKDNKAPSEHFWKCLVINKSSNK